MWSAKVEEAGWARARPGDTIDRKDPWCVGGVASSLRVVLTTAFGVPIVALARSPVQNSMRTPIMASHLVGWRDV
jgi:hypothetical protein